MVYCGKPSKGCKSCRARKIRCDQKEPTCTQCARLGKECPGYRNMLDLSFRNESDRVIAKVKAKSKKSPPKVEKAVSTAGQCPIGWPTNVDSSLIPRISVDSAASPESLNFPSLPFSDLLWSTIQDGTEQPMSFSTFTIFPTVKECGMSFFFNSFVLSPQGPSHGYFSYIPELCSIGGMDDMLEASMTAAGLAGQANICKSLQMMAQARKEYAIALQKINKALRSPTEAVKDSTLSSIIVLALFEAAAGGKQLSLKEWTEHINGAATLVRLRGPAQLQTRVGFGLFIQATAHLLVSCLQREIPMPQQIIDLRKQAMAIVPNDPGWQFHKLTDQITIFRSEIGTGAAGGQKEVISKAIELDTELARVFSEAPLDWMYETVYTDEESEVLFDGCYHIYYDHWIAQLWNGMRATRIMLNEIIRGQLLDGIITAPPVFTIAEFSSQFHISTDNIYQLRDDILHSIPQHLGYINRKPFQPIEIPPEIPTPIYPNLTTTTPLSFTSPLHPNPHPPSSGGYFLLWPLFVSGITRHSTPSIRAFAARILHHVGEVLGIRQGTNLGAFMMSMPEPVPGEKGGLDERHDMREAVKNLRDMRPIGMLRGILRKEEAERRMMGCGGGLRDEVLVG